MTGHVVWVDTESGGDVKVLIESENGTFMAGLYRYSQDVDIYIDHISLESYGDKYKNLTEIKVKPKQLSSLKDLTSGIEKNTDYEISTKISMDSFDPNKIQDVYNAIKENGKRNSIKTGSEMEGQILITKATPANINDGDAILGNFNGVSDEITIRIYDSTDSQVDSIEKNYDVVNIRNF